MRMDQSLADLERQRADADRHYNDALTAFDRAVVAAGAQPTIDRGDFSRVATALVVFLQQVTAFVDTKDREIQARFAQRLDELAPALAAAAELRTKVTVLERTLDLVTRTLASPAPASASSAPAAPHQSTQPPSRGKLDDVAYVGFEDEFRGSEEGIQTRLREYVPLFSGASDVVDVGCGRGEFLAALANAGVAGRGVDINSEMVAVARAHGVDAHEGDALSFLTGLPDESVGGLMSAQVVEHLEPAYLLRLLSVARRKLRAGAPIVIETINPACWLAFFSSYIRDLTHVRPIHPETLQYLLRANGFERVSLRYSAPVPEQVKMKPIELTAEVTASPEPSARALVETARVVNANATILNSLLFTHLDYAAIGYRS
jgi:SAM-dependent methyltransferase